MLIDSHCHLASHKFSIAELPELLERAAMAGVTQMISLATCLDDIAQNLAITRENPQVKVCLGIHPCDVHHAPDNATDLIAAYLDDKNVVGIGETGLDYYHAAPDGWSDETFRQRQRDFLESHFILAKRFSLPVVIHTRDQIGSQSFEDALEIYQRHADHVRALFHCFISTKENAERVISRGGMVSFGGVATFKSAANVLAVASALPQGTFLLETDSPYLAPMPHRGKRNEPSFVKYTAEHIAAARSESLEEISSHTSKAAWEFFPRLAQ
jgi:TatD DNase family protein